jgi:flagellar protein FlaG
MTGQIAAAGNPASSIGVDRASPPPTTRTPRVSTPPPSATANAPLPLDGKPSPREGHAPEVHIDVEQARASIERFVRSMKRELEFTVDEASGRTVITVRNKETGEVIRQIPSEEVIALARAYAEGQPVLLDSQA